MRIVLDTNVLLSALLTPQGVPAQVLMLTLAGELTLPDRDDRAFVEVALSGHADALVTGNARHFPPDLGIIVLSPRALLERIDSQ